jgi:hypothetical protein
MFRAAHRSSSGVLTVFAASDLHTHVVTGCSYFYWVILRCTDPWILKRKKCYLLCCRFVVFASSLNFRGLITSDVCLALFHLIGDRFIVLLLSLSMLTSEQYFMLGYGLSQQLTSTNCCSIWYCITEAVLKCWLDQALNIMFNPCNFPWHSCFEILLIGNVIDSCLSQEISYQTKINTFFVSWNKQEMELAVFTYVSRFCVLGMCS